jgi:hypothetical protein
LRREPALEPVEVTDGLTSQLVSRILILAGATRDADGPARGVPGRDVVS